MWVGIEPFLMLSESILTLGELRLVYIPHKSTAFASWRGRLSRVQMTVVLPRLSLWPAMCVFTFNDQSNNPALSQLSRERPNYKLPICSSADEAVPHGIHYTLMLCTGETWSFTRPHIDAASREQGRSILMTSSHYLGSEIDNWQSKLEVHPGAWNGTPDDE